MDYLLEMPEAHMTERQKQCKRMLVALRAYRLRLAELQVVLGKEINGQADITPEERAKFLPLVTDYIEAAEVMKTAVLIVRDRLIDPAKSGRAGGKVCSERKAAANRAHGFKRKATTPTPANELETA